MKRPRIPLRTRREITINLRAAYFSLVGSLVALLLVYLFLVGFLDLREVISIGISDAIVTIVIVYVSGESRRGSLAQAAGFADVAREYSHLRGHVIWSRKYLGNQLYYVENTQTKQAYWAPDWVGELIDLGAIQTQWYKHKVTGKEMDSYFDNKGVKLNEQPAKVLELLTTSPTQKEKARSFAYFE